MFHLYSYIEILQIWSTFMRSYLMIYMILLYDLYEFVLYGAFDNVILFSLSAIANEKNREIRPNRRVGQFYITLTILTHWLTELNYHPILALYLVSA